MSVRIEKIKASIMPGMSFSATLNITVVSGTGATITATDGTHIYTATESDGSAIITIKAAGTYMVTATLNGQTGSITDEVTVSMNGGTYTAEVGFEATGHIYGVYSDYSAAALTRTDDAAEFTNPEAYIDGSTIYGSPFDNLMPWSGIERVSNSEAGELVKIPKFWYKLAIDHTVPDFKLQIADYAAEGFYPAPAFQDRGDGKGERNVVYVSRYSCSSTNYKSISGGTPYTGLMENARTGIHALGSDIWQWDYAMLVTIQMLYLVEYASWHSRFKIGQGNRSGTTCGNTDSMPYHTGNIGTAHGSLSPCQYRYIENLWDGQIKTLCDGIRFDRFERYIIKNPAEFSTTSGGELIGPRCIGGKYEYGGYWGYITSFGIGGLNELDWAWEPDGVTEDRPIDIYHTFMYDTYSYHSEGKALGVCQGGLFQYQSVIPNPSGSGVSGQKFRLMYLP